MRKIAMKTLAIAVTALFVTAGTADGQQVADVSQWGFDHTGDIDQVGTLNRGFITQGAPGDEATGPSIVNDFRAEITQTGVDNFGTIDQDGNGLPDAFIDQIGDDNFGSQTQTIFGSDRALADIDQTGDDNRATQLQNYSGGTAGLVMKAEAFQDGDLNVADQSQTGSSQLFRSLVDQDGTDNFATVSQSGTTGAGFFSDVVQVGNDNVATVSQSN